MTYAVYRQATGHFEILDYVDDGPHQRVVYEATGYAGHGLGRNDPSFEEVRDVGPIPKGMYRVSLEPHAKFAAPAFRLQPLVTNQMFGRSGFWIHGDSLVNPGSASRGCIILHRTARRWIEHFEVKTLEVVPG